MSLILHCHRSFLTFIFGSASPSRPSSNVYGSLTFGRHSAHPSLLGTESKCFRMGTFLASFVWTLSMSTSWRSLNALSTFVTPVLLVSSPLLQATHSGSLAPFWMATCPCSLVPLSVSFLAKALSSLNYQLLPGRPINALVNPFMLQSVR